MENKVNKRTVVNCSAGGGSDVEHVVVAHNSNQPGSLFGYSLQLHPATTPELFVGKLLCRIIKFFLDFERNYFISSRINLIPKFSFHRKFANKDGYWRQGQSCILLCPEKSELYFCQAILEFFV
jgi:hypothetical protein